MDAYEIKFSFDCKSVNKQQFENLFANIEKCLNMQFDEKYNAFLQDNTEIFQYRDVSNQTSEDINKIVDSFFSSLVLILKIVIMYLCINF